MALSSWLGFGKKKPTELPSDTKTTSPEDDFVVLDDKPQPANNMYPVLGPGGSIVLPYQVQPSFPGSGASPESVDSLSCNPLDDVPFKLNSLLLAGSCNWSRNDAAHFKSVVSRAVHHNETVYKYDFSHEKSIVRESNQGG